MKYGIVYYKNTDNIGDDIQNYAVQQFLPRVDYLIDREQIDKSISADNVAVIMNGWYLHNKFNWPPAKNIIPLCISMHFSENDYMGIGYDFLDGVGGEYLKCNQPIGCRDSSTLNALTSRGIQAYLSGCATLTIKSRRKYNCNKYICITDVPGEVEEKIISDAKRHNFEIKKCTHWVNYGKESLSWEQRMKAVEELLDIYQNASCVITKRLHCALPCLAMGTPVLLLLDDKKDDMSRYYHFDNFVYHFSTEEFLLDKCDYDIFDPPSNKEDYLSERTRIEEQIKKFVTKCENEIVPDGIIKWREEDSNKIVDWRLELATNAARFAANNYDSLLRDYHCLETQKYNQIVELGNDYNNAVENFQQLIEDKDAECDRLEKVIKEKNNEQDRLNAVIVEKQKKLNNIEQFVHNMESTSVMWLIFFSKKYKNAIFTKKIKMLFLCVKNKKNMVGGYIEDIE